MSDRTISLQGHTWQIWQGSGGGLVSRYERTDCDEAPLIGSQWAGQRRCLQGEEENAAAIRQQSVTLNGQVQPVLSCRCLCDEVPSSDRQTSRHGKCFNRLLPSLLASSCRRFLRRNSAKRGCSATASAPSGSCF